MTPMVQFKRRNLSNDLLQSIKKREWDKAYLYLNQASLPGNDEEYALHEVCDDPTAPINIVIDIYNAFPKAALIRANDELTPLYVAVNAGFENAVHFLANACPKACVIYNNLGSLPIHSATYNVIHINMIDSLLIASPETVFLDNKDRDSAFDLFFRNLNVVTRIALYNQSLSNKVLENSIGHGIWKIRDIYQKTCLFLNAANLHDKKNTVRNSCLLHCALRSRSCHWAFCKLLMELHPEQVLGRDLDGNLPIHIITACDESSDEETFLCIDCFAVKNNLVKVEYTNGNTDYCCEECFEFGSRELVSKSFLVKPVPKVHGMVRQLIAIAPQMVLIANGKGNYPIHTAIHNQQSYETIYALLEAFPVTGKIRDLETKLLPFMLAAVGNWKSEKDQVSITFQLLREDPHSIFEV